MHDLRKILVIRLSSIGDVVHALPAVAALGTAYPNSKITWLIEARYAEILEGNPFVERVLTTNTLAWQKEPLSRRTLREAARTVRALREETFDAVIDFQGLIKTGIIARIARARRRIGLASKWLKEPGAALFYSERAPARGSRHVVEENLALVKWLGVQPGPWQFPLPRSEAGEQWAEAQLARLGAAQFILVSPGAGWAAKRWPPGCYAQLIGMLEQEGWTVVLTGSAAEENEILAILRESAAQHAAYVPASIRQFITLARRARLFIGGDTGPMHLAAAVGTPIVAMFGPTDPSRNGPFDPADITLSNGEPVNHTRRAKTPRFLEGVSIADVVAAVHERLARNHEC